MVKSVHHGAEWQQSRTGPIMADDYDYDDRYADDKGTRPRRSAYGRDDSRERDRYDYRDDRPRRGRREAPKQSGWGVLSFVTSLAVGVGLFLVIGVAVVMAMENGGNPPPDDSPEVMALGFAILAGLFA